MSSERWRRLEALFDAALAQPPASRDAWLSAQGLDDDLRAELERMIAADADDAAQLTARIGGALAGAADGPAAGQRIGDWRLIRELGSGGAGVVYLAERADDQFRQEVALKVIRGFATPDAARQLRHERRVLAALEHPNIARLIDGGETEDGHPYLVMEFVRGEPIGDACRRRNLPLRERIALVRDIARAVHYAHQRLVIHRDIKPGNVLLRDDGRPALLDFGIAKLLDAEAGAATATQPWFTPAYASPEQRRGDPVSTATDVHALGLLLCELLTDALPVADPDGRVGAPSLHAPRHRRAALRGDLDRIVARACAPEPARRYASAEAFADDLERWLAGRPVRATADTVSYRFRKLLRRHPLGTAAALGVALVLAVFGWRLADERNRALRAEAVALDQSAAAESVTRFLIDLFRDADPNVVRDRRLTPSELIDRGRERLAAQRDVPALQRARLLGSLGEIYGAIGQPEKATAVLEEALSVAEGQAMAELERSQLLRQLGRAYDDRGEYQDAGAAFERAVEASRRAGDRAAEADALASYGLALSRQREFSRAEPVLLRALRLAVAEHGETSIEVATMRSYLAELLQLAGRIEEARATMDTAIAAMRRALPGDDPDLLAALTIHSSVLRESGDARGSEAVLREIIGHRERLLERNSVLLATAYSELGSAYYEQGRTREAAEQLAQALEIGQRTLAPDDASLAIDYNNLASLHEEMGDFARGLPLMRHALSVVEGKSDQIYYAAQFRQNLGRMLMLAGRSAEALPLLERPIPEGEGAGFALQRARRSLHLAEWHRRYGDLDEARRWVDAVEADRDALGGPESPRYAQLLRTRALIAARRGAPGTAQRDLERALAVAGAARGEDYVFCGDLALDLAALALEAGDAKAARARLEQARRIHDPVLVPEAPQWARHAELAARLARGG